MATFPGGVWTIPTRGALMSDAVTQTDILDSQNEEILAIEQTLGTNPQGSLATVKARLERLEWMATPAEFVIAPASNVDATTTGSFVTWLTSADPVTVPTGATKALIQVNITNVTAINNSALYGIDATLSGSSYVSDRAAISFAGAGDAKAVALSRVVQTTPGSRSVLVGARRVSGSGQARAGSTTKVSGYVFFLP